MPSERLVVPRSAATVLPPALGLPVTGGHAAAHGPVQMECGPESRLNRHTVECLGPYARTVPSLLCLLVTSAAGAAPLTPAAVADFFPDGDEGGLQQRPRGPEPFARRPV